MATPESDPGPRWREMQDAIKRAQERPIEVIEAVATSPTRADAAASLGALLGVDGNLGDQLLDLRISDFVARLR